MYTYHGQVSERIARIKLLHKTQKAKTSPRFVRSKLANKNGKQVSKGTMQCMDCRELCGSSLPRNYAEQVFQSQGTTLSKS